MADTYKKFNSEDFYAVLASVVARRQKTWKQVGLETGVSASTLTRMAQGKQPDAASLAALSAWADINPADYVDRPGKVNPEPLAAISTLLRADPNLDDKSVVALDAIIQAAYDNLKRDGKKKK